MNDLPVEFVVAIRFIIVTSIMSSFNYFHQSPTGELMLI